MAQTDDEESTLLLAKLVKEEDELMILNEKGIVPKLNKTVNNRQEESNVWY